MSEVLKRVVAPLVILGLVVWAAIAIFSGGSSKTLVAHFPRAISIYEGSDVRVLGVAIGQVDKVEPTDTDVTVTMHYDADVKIPVDAKAVVIAPSIVGDRYIQLTPVYEKGDVLSDGTVLDEGRTAVPLELDQIYGDIDNLTVALGPEGANKNGALSDLLAVTAKNFGGAGADFNRTLKNFGRLSQTLEDNKDDLFGSAKELEGFIGKLAENDTTVRRFNTSLAQVARELSGQRGELGQALHNLAGALGQVTEFVRDNRDALGSNIDRLNRVAKIFVKQREAFEEVLSAGPTALTNLNLTYNPQAGTLDTNGNITEIEGQIQEQPGVLLCGILGQIDPTGELCNLVRSLPGASRAGVGSMNNAGAPLDRFDPTLGGLVAVDR